MKRMMAAAAVPLLAAVGCTGTFGASATCTGSGDCSFSGEIKGTMLRVTGAPADTLLQRWTAAKLVFDAADVTMGLDGSTVALPLSGLVTLRLSDSSSGLVQAAQVFGWTRQGSVIRLVDPDAVNAWAMAYGGTADALAFQAHPFAVQAGAGANTLRVTSYYLGVAQASGSTNWTSSGCSRYARCLEQ